MDEQRRKLVDGYMKEEISPQRYVARNKALDSQIANLNANKEKLAYVISARSGNTEKSIKRFCSKAKVRFEESTDFESKQSFLREYIEKITFIRGRFSIVGSVHGEDSVKTTLPFRIESEIDYRKSRINTERRAH